jgi:hypothetical protein
LDTLKDMEKKGTLIDEERDRLVVLRARAAKKREQSRGLRPKAVLAQGLGAVQQRERKWDRTRRARRTADPVKYKYNLEKAAAIEATRRANGGQPKAKGEKRIIGGKDRYPEYFKKMLREAAKRFVRLYGHETVCWNAIVKLFDKLLFRERHNEKMKGLVRFTKVKGTIMYIGVAYREAASPYLERRTVRTWTVKNTTGFERNGKSTDDIADEVIATFY